jgi:TonB-dependent receptor
MKSPLCFALSIVLAAALPPAVSAQSAGTGTLEGRVSLPATGEYLENALVSVEGTTLETLTNAGGNYRLRTVPAGTVRVRVFFTGLAPQTSTVAVGGGQTVTHDIALGTASSRPAGARADAPVVLSEFVVGASREMTGAAIAINEQRFAANIKNVVAADEFGHVAEGNVAEFLKFLPGVTIDYAGGNALEISLNGVPSANVPVTVDGFNLAGAEGTGTSRSVQAGFASTNNLSRIEVSFSPTPESQGAALAGSVNMVPRSAFERLRPAFTGSVYLGMRDNARDFNRTPGPLGKPTRKVHPGFDFSYIAPVNKRFGFTVSGGSSTQYVEGSLITNTWRGATSTTNGAAFPHTTPDRPYLSSVLVSDRPKNQTQRSFGATLDYKLTANDRLSFSFQYSSYDETNILRSLTFNVNRVLPGDFSPTATRGAAAAGSLVLARTGRNRVNRNFTPTFVWRHDGPRWKSEAGLGASRAISINRDFANGYLNGTTAQRSGVTVAFDDIFYLRPRVITVTDGATGAPLDPYRLDNYALTTTTVTNPRDVTDTQLGAYANARRDFWGPVPFTLKGGLDFRQTLRDNLGSTLTASFVGRDGRPSTAPTGQSDDSAAPFLDASFSQRTAPYGYPKIQYVSNEQLWVDYRDNPTHFVPDLNAEYRSRVTTSKRAEELVSAAYVRGDAQFFDRRLKLIGGLRLEQTNVEALGPLDDPTRNFQRNANGTPILGTNGRPLLVVPTSNALGVSQLTYLERGLKAEKEYLRIFPSLNAAYSLRENLIARAAYYYSVGRPDFNQYAGGVTLPDTTLAPTPNNRITINNAGIKAWSARTLNVRLEYYFEGVGQVSVGAFQREFENFFAGTTFAATPEFLALYGLDPATYERYDVSTQYNVDGTVRMQGVDFAYRQALTFLPRWARGVQVFANVSAQRATGPNLGSFTGANSIPRSGSWGVSLARERYNLRVNWNYRGRQRRAEVAAGPSIEPGTYNWASKRLFVDVMGDVKLSRHLALFANIRNLGGAPEDMEIAGPSTPPHAQFRSRQEYGVLWTFGLRGTF